MKRILNAVSWTLIALIFSMITTGGVIIPLKKGFIELSQVDIWILVLGALTLIQQKVTKEGETAPPLIRSLSWLRDRLANPPQPILALGLALSGFAVLTALIHAFRMYQMDTVFSDHGIIQHVLASTWIRKPFQCEVCINGTFLGDHLALALVLVAPVAGIFQRPEPVFLAQCLALAGGTFLLLRYGPIRKARDLWLFGLIAILCHSQFRFTWYGVDFREDHLAFLFLSVAAVGAYRLNWPIFILGSALSALCKENVAFIIPFLSLAGALQARQTLAPETRKRAYLFFLIGSGVSLVWIALTFKVLLPHFAGNSPAVHEIVSRFPGMGSTPGEVVKTLLASPGKAAQLLFGHVFDRAGARYLLLLLLPWIFFMRKGWIWFLPALAGILMNVLSGKPEQRTMHWHYELIIYPFLILALLEGFRRASKKEVLLGLFFALAFSERWPMLDLRERWPSSAQFRTAEWFQRIPKQGLLGASFNTLGPPATRAEVIPFQSVGNFPHPSWKEFRDRNFILRPDRTQDQWIDRARWLVFDTLDTRQLDLSKSAPAEWSVRSKSPDKRFILLERVHR